MGINGDISTSLTTSAMSMGHGTYFCNFWSTPFPSARVHWFVRESADLASMILSPTAWLGPRCFITVVA